MTKEHFHFSDRFGLLGDLNAENPIYQIKTERIKTGKPILDLGNSNLTEMGLEFPASVLTHILSNLNASIYEPIPEGLESTRNEISSHYKTRGFQVNSSNFHLTASTSEAYSYLFKLLTNPGDEVLTPNPGYPLFSFLIGLENLKEVHYQLKENQSDGSWVYDAETIANSISTKTKLIVLVSPSNPTGSKTTESFWKIWESFGIQIPVIVDEVFEAYDFFGEPHHLPSNPNFPLFVCHGFSKMLALPQTKLAWILNLSPEPIKTEIQKKLSFISDTYLSVNSLVQLATNELLPWKTMVQNRIRTRIMRNYSLCKEFVNQFSYSKKVHAIEAGWYFLLELNLDKKDEKIVGEILLETGVLLHPGSWYGFSHNRCIVVISLITEEEILEKGLNSIQSFFK
ncbi:pyridoxal phosphate-dependent aminotransferase [Leptospira levettii]|uniref:pyridoxal phosphate-dependent aminotransferase n=1 Tax=Leptospira levettii TaxID=2023178 RepID=UPI0010828ECC|nr:pyridoxal phosphate-dependent aminotransferase [Leptospira levettii]TGL13824.1 pyridoxal phosphate-dependent aminotransferase [Leptospira levettii]